MKSIKKARTQRLAGTQRINSLSEGWALARENVMRIDLCKHDLLCVIDSLDEQIIKCSYGNVKATAKDLSDYADDLAELAHNIKAASIGIRDFVDTTMGRRNPKVRTEVYDNEFDPDGWEEDEDTARNTMRAPKKRTARYADDGYEDDYSDEGYEEYEDGEQDDYDVEITPSDIDADLEDMPSYRKMQEPAPKQEPKPNRKPQPEYSEVITADEADEDEEQEPEEAPRKQRPRRRQRTSQTK